MIELFWHLRTGVSQKTVHHAYTYDPDCPGKGNCGSLALAAQIYGKLLSKDVKIYKATVDRRTHYFCGCENVYFDLSSDQCGIDLADFTEIPESYRNVKQVEIKCSDTRDRAMTILEDQYR